MKKILVLILISIIGISCETESASVQNDPVDNLTANPVLVGKLMRLAQHATTIDNVVDGTSCFGIELPVTVIANGATIEVNSESDYQQIRNIFAQNENDVDTAVIQFPITITYTDYSQEVLSSQSELNAAATGCVESIELSCINLSFPLSVNIYDTQSQIADSFSLSSEMSLFDFLNQLDVNSIVALVYPLTLTAPNGTQIVIESNSELESTITSFIAECEAAVNPQPDPPLQFDDVITDGTWFVAYFFDNTVQTGEYVNYDFTFNPNGTTVVMNESTQTGGTWDTYIDSGNLKLVLSFTASQLNDLEEDWYVQSFTATTIVMLHESGGGGGVDYLTLQKN